MKTQIVKILSPLLFLEISYDSLRRVQDFAAFTLGLWEDWDPWVWDYLLLQCGGEKEAEQWTKEDPSEWREQQHYDDNGDRQPKADQLWLR